MKVGEYDGGMWVQQSTLRQRAWISCCRSLDWQTLQGQERTRRVLRSRAGVYWAQGGTEESDSNQHQQTFNNNAKWEVVDASYKVRRQQKIGWLVCLRNGFLWYLWLCLPVFTCFYMFLLSQHHMKRCKNWPRHGDGSREALVIQGSGLPRCRCDAKKCATRCHEVQSELSQLTMHHQALQHGPPNRRDKLVQSCPNKQDYTLYDHYFKKMCNVQVASHEKMFAMWCHVQKTSKNWIC